MLNSYLKEQRQIHKEVEKKRKTQKDLWEFYENKKLEAIRLQYLRYNFFTDKHLSIVKNFLISSMEANNELARVFGMEEKRNIEEEIIHQNAMAMAVENQKRESIVSPENARENIMPSPVLQRSSQRLKRLPASETFPPYDGTITNFLNNLGEEDSPKNPYQSLPPLPAANPLAPIYRPPTPIQQRPLPPPPREVIQPTVNPLPRPPKPTQQPQPYVTRDRPVSQPSYQYDSLERPVTISPNPPIQQLPPVIQPRKERQLFTASDYGSILVCKMPYSAATDRQLSLNVNEQVQLIRSGERGWVLVKTSAGQK
uniref:SH3 domain-containing protein n=1 Tax=Panagrolaimus superbus TaxID=310955 RepID=A0A914Z631_9BILA